MRVADLHCDTIGLIYSNREVEKNYQLKENNFHIDISKKKCKIQKMHQYIH